MNRLEAYLCRLLLPRLLSQACPAQVPRSGKDGEQVNCFFVSVDKQGKPYLLVDAIRHDTLDCREWDGKSYSTTRTVALAGLQATDLFIVHYYGLAGVRYSGIIDLAVGRILLTPYIKVHVRRILMGFSQYFFNRRKLVTKQRVTLLSFLLERHLYDKNEFEAFSLMTELYSIKWVLHPEGDAQLRKVEFFLDAMSETGELRKSGYKYSLTGHALKAIEEYEEQERRHVDNVKIQRRALWLTVFIALLTAAQAGLFKLPTILDLSALKWIWP